MTSTNRFANRLFLLLIGLIVFLCGLVAIGAALVPALRSSWGRLAPNALNDAESLLRRPAVPGTDVSWVLIGAFAGCVVLVAALIVFIARQGRGQTRDLLIQQAGEHGTVIIDAQLAADLLHDALADEPQILAAHVTAHRMRGAAVLKITVSCRRGASPGRISARIEQLLVALDDLLGFEAPALVQISSGIRTLVSASARLEQPARGRTDLLTP